MSVGEGGWAGNRRAGWGWENEDGRVKWEGFRCRVSKHGEGWGAGNRGVRGP